MKPVYWRILVLIGYLPWGVVMLVSFGIHLVLYVPYGFLAGKDENWFGEKLFESKITLAIFKSALYAVAHGWPQGRSGRAYQRSHR